MYERSAIVLERYFSNILGYTSENNLKVNFDNYCNLVETLEEFQQAYAQEQAAIQDFNNITEGIKETQKNQERLYKKSAKLEYNRNLLFTNVEEKPEEIEKCIIKIEEEADKNIEAQKGLREKFISSITEYNDKKSLLNRSKKDRKAAEKKYNEIFQMANENARNINEFKLEFARNFTGTEIKEKLVKLMIENGKGEKNPFDEGVINCAAELGLDIAQREIECYVDMYDNIMRLFEEIDKDCIKLDKFKKRMRNTKVKLNFLFAEKEYLVQFLDYERITVVNGKRTHKKLMEEACENLKADVAQINNLYELILREIATKSTKKGYKELYNKSYLIDINEKEAKFKKEKNKVNANVATVLNSNYWRIEGIKNIYTVFYNDVSEVFGRDLEEFDIPEDGEEDESVEEIVELPVEEPEIEVTGIEKVEQEKVNMFENFVTEESEDEEETTTFEEDEESETETFEEDDDDVETETFEEDISEEAEDEEFDIFSGKYENLDYKIKEFSELENAEEFKRSKKSEKNIQEIEFEEDEEVDIFGKFGDTEIENTEKIFEDEEESIFEDDIPYEEDEISYEAEDEEESLFVDVKNIKKVRKTRNTATKVEKKENAKTKGLFNAFKKMNGKRVKKATN